VDADPDVLHLHEWQASAAAMLYWDSYHAKGLLANARLVLTIHNLDNSGECRQDEFAATGVPGAPLREAPMACCMCMPCAASARQIESRRRVRRVQCLLSFVTALPVDSCCRTSDD
jgi:Starch synthase catalytic domain